MLFFHQTMFLAVLVVGFASLFLPETTAQNAAIKKKPETKGEKVVKETVDDRVKIWH